jgi:hypothetical protein
MPHAFSRSRALHWVAAACAVVAVPLLLHGAHGNVLNIDEARYVAAAQLGVLANATDGGSLSARDFLAFVLSKWHHEAPRLPAGYQESRDPFLLRNLHPPFLVYPIVPFADLQDEARIRAGLVIGGMLLLISLFWSYSTITPQATPYGVAVVAVADSLPALPRGDRWSRSRARPEHPAHRIRPRSGGLRRLAPFPGSPRRVQFV